MTLEGFFAQRPEAAVALSGGVDSALLLYMAARYARRAAAYFVSTVFQPASELEDALGAAERAGVPLRVIRLDILSAPGVAANPPDRCYHCKRALFTALLARALDDGFPLVLDGSNASDDESDRPGARALRELGVLSPLRLCGLAKSDVRRLAREAGLKVWNKPSCACLATRVPSGTAITREDLSRAERGESVLAAMGFSDFRLRLRGDGGLLQVRPEQMGMAEALLPSIRAALSGDLARVDLDPVPRAARET